MEFLRRLFGGEKREVVFSEKFEKWILDGNTSAGQTVNDETAFRLATVYGCVNVIAQTVGSLPIKLYKKTSKGRELISENSLYQLLHRSPNSILLPSAYKEVVMCHLLTWGNSYSEIEYNNGGDIIGLWPIHPSRVQPELYKKGGTFAVRFNIRGADSSVKVLNTDKIMHIPGLSGLSPDGISGVTPITKSSAAFGKALASQNYASKFFTNDANPGGVLSTPATLSEEARKYLKKSIEASHTGPENAHRFMLLEEGLKWEAIGLSPMDSQMLDNIKFSGNEICGMFRVPPHKVGLPELTTNNNIEAQNISFLTDTISPWLTKIAEAVNKSLIPAKMSGQMYAEFSIDSYLRGDIATRTASYAAGIQNGWYSVNDIRRMENLNSVDGGDQYYHQVNMAPITTEPSNLKQEN